MRGPGNRPFIFDDHLSDRSLSVKPALWVFEFGLRPVEMRVPHYTHPGSGLWRSRTLPWLLVNIVPLWHKTLDSPFNELSELWVVR
jgi:hypothetical protein